MKSKQHIKPSIMKNLLLIVLLFTGIVNAQIVNIPDANFKAFLVNTTGTNLNALDANNNYLKIDQNNDGEIQVSEAQMIGGLYILNLPNITSLIGIQNFPNIHTIWCDTDQISNLDVSGLSNLTLLNIKNNPLSVLNIAGCSALQGIALENTLVSTINLSGFTNLTNIYVPNNQIASINVTGCNMLNAININNNLLTTLDTSGLGLLTGITIENNPGLTTVNASNCNSLTSFNYSIYNSPVLTNLNFTNCSSITYLYFPQHGITSFLVSGCSSLNTLDVSQNSLTSLNLSGCSSLNTLFCQSNQLTALDLSGSPSLATLFCFFNQIASFNISGCTNLVDVRAEYNQIPSSLNVSGYISLTNLTLNNNPTLTSFNAAGCIALANLTLPSSVVSCNVSNCSVLPMLQIIDGNNAGALTNLNVSGCTLLANLQVVGTALATLDISNLPNLATVKCYSNKLTTITTTASGITYLDLSRNLFTNLNVTNLTNLNYLDCSFNLLTQLNATNLNSLTTLNCNTNSLSTIDLTGLTNLTNLNFTANAVSTIALNSLTNLVSLTADSNLLTSLDLNNLANLSIVSCNNNLLTSVLFSTLLSLTVFQVNDNQLTTLDFSASHLLTDLRCSNNQLTQLFIKNGSDETLEFINPTLQYICADESQIAQIKTNIGFLINPAIVVNSYCTFTPGGNYNTITGTIKFDANSNGCDATDNSQPDIRVNLNDGTNNGASFTSNTGNYTFYTQTGSFDITPNIENPTWFNFSPITATIPFANNNNNTATQNFCISANGVHNDVEIVIAPIAPARPGFDAVYQLVYKNNGNQTLSGNFNLVFNDNLLDFINATTIPNNQITSVLGWYYTNLLPFENRTVYVTFHVNAPTDTPPVNISDVLNFTSTINSVTGDELPNDNQFTYNQTVVGSYDPNDITCLEGDTVSPSQIGNYLHYAINFENLGTFYAENIVVRCDIDPLKYDINTLQVMNTSHPTYTKITGNVIEFVFQGINLAAAAGNPPVGGHGDVLFKIKTKDNLVNNDTVLQRAGIYFDYNFPVATNDAETTFATLNNSNFEQDNSVKMYPNPTNSTININSNFNIKSIELYDIQGRILETILEDSSVFRLDISSKSNGIYFLKIKTDKGSKVEKIVKE